MRRPLFIFLMVALLCMPLSACRNSIPMASQSRFMPSQLRAFSSQPDSQSALSREQYIEWTTRIIQEDLKAGDAKTLQAFIEWGKTQPEYFPGSRNTISQQLLQNLPRTSQYVQELEQLLQMPVPALQAESYRPINFAIDQGNHPNKLAEWWYYNGHLKTDIGKTYGYELCLFRVAPVIFFAHVAITDENNQTFTYTRDFFRPSNVDLSTVKGDIRYGALAVKQLSSPYSYHISGKVESFDFDLRLQLTKEPLIINGDGLIDMPEGGNSYYYSLTRLKTDGILSINGQPHAVTGQSWFDHQWGHFVAWRIGWDWFSFQMDDGTEYNLFGFRKRSGKRLKRYVNIQNAQNRSIHSKEFRIERLKWWKSPATGRLYVTQWRIYIPETQETFEVEAVQPDQEVAARKAYDLPPTYWEGSCRVTKILPDGTRIKGVSYVEHFDYTRQIGAD